MAMIAIPIAADVSRLFRSIPVSGARDPSDHVTMFYLGDDINLNVILDIIPVLYEMTLNVKPFEVTCSKITSFSKGKNGYPVIGLIKSDPLLELREKIKKLLDRNRIKFDNTFSDYKPHVTLSHSKKRQKTIKLPQKYSWKVNQVSLYGGDETDSRIFVNFPLDLGVEKTAIDRLTDIYYNLAENVDTDSASYIYHKLIK
jgi:2'-5' RNA ligase